MALCRGNENEISHVYYTYYWGQHDQIPRVISGKTVGNDSEVRRNYSHRINLREFQSQRTDLQDVCHVTMNINHHQSDMGG